MRAKNNNNYSSRSRFQDLAWLLLKVAIAVALGMAHRRYVSTLHEGDLHFSYLSTIEREMTFRTEMGFYYSFFKTVIEAPTFWQGVSMLYRNNLTEYPDTINALKRFNLYPEVMVGAAYKVYDSAAETFGWQKMTCYRIDRGQGLSPVMSCEGLGDPALFYTEAVWLAAGVTVAFLFLISCHLAGGSILGGFLAVTCFFYNHKECTRVQWTPPLRESFAFPISFIQMYLLTVLLDSDSSHQFRRRLPYKGLQDPPGRASIFKHLMLGATTAAYIASWQFAQFAVFTQVFAVHLVDSLGLLTPRLARRIYTSILSGLALATLLLFGNAMLLVSWLTCCLLSSMVVSGLSNLSWPHSDDEEHGVEARKVREHRQREVRSSSLGTLLFKLCLRSGFVLVLTVALKMVLSKALAVQDDAHISDLLRSKFSGFKNFHTLLYTCAAEFDFLGTEMPKATSMTLLLPSAALALSLVALRVLVSGLEKDSLVYKMRASEDKDSLSKTSEIPGLDSVSPGLIYHVLQLMAFGFMAIIIMRLKLFFTPHLCILTAVLVNQKLVPLVPNKAVHLSLIALLVAGMSVQGVDNVRHQLSIQGEFSDPALEETLEWIMTKTLPEASFAGPMPSMANILLSTRRPVVMHPHYEDVGLRERTKQVYRINSRTTAEAYHRVVADLKVKYLLLAKVWCFRAVRGDGCGMTDIWDIEEPWAGRSPPPPPLCPDLFGDSDKALDKEPQPMPFKRVFRNDNYCILEV